MKVAIKQSSYENVKKEFEILGKLQQHTNILHCLNRAQINGQHVLVTEIFNKTLHEAIKDDLNEKSMMLQLANAVNYLSHQKIIHVDIAPQNIFIVTVGREKILKLGNFENSFHGEEIKDVKHKNLTDGFKAPEILVRATAYTQSCLWSLGCVYVFMATKGFKIHDTRSRNNVPARLNAIIDNSTSEKILFKNLLCKILRLNHLERIKSEKISDHPYFWNALQTLNFIIEVANAIESPINFYDQIKGRSRNVFRGDWTQKIDSELLEEIKSTRKNFKQKYSKGEVEQEENLNGMKISTLITNIRNMKCHFRSQSIKNIVGESDEEFLKYWTTRFPALIMQLHEAMEQYQKLMH